MRRIPFRSRNPALNYKTFYNMPRAKAGEAMAVVGVISKTTFALIILSISAVITWNAIDKSSNLRYLVSVGFIGGLAVAILTYWRRDWAKFTLLVYSILKGIALGGMSLYFERRFLGMVSTTIFLTFGGLGALLLIYRTGIIKITTETRSLVYVVTGGIFIVYMFSWMLRYIDVRIPVIHDATLYGILFSLFALTMTSLNLILNFEYIERGVKYSNHCSMEWYATFGLLVTLVWFYLEIPRLFSKIIRFSGP